MKRTKKRKIKLGRLFLFFFIVFLIIFIVWSVFNIRIKNIVIIGNHYLSDQQVIDMAGISDYPSVLKSFKVTKKLEENIYINTADIKVKKLNQLYITVDENRPLFYSEHMQKTILFDGTSIDERFAAPSVLNYIVDDVYQEFVKQMRTIDINIINRISEIEYKPTNVDTSLFFLTMTDGNFVYINNLTFYKLNKYIDIIKNFPNKQGILYLDYGNNFEIID